MISVVMPVFNVEHYVGAAIASVLSQTYQDFELIIVDDGSTDNSLQVAQVACRGDPRVKLIRQINRGLGAARNRGLAEVLGEYVYLLDSDDYLAPEALETCADNIETHRLDLFAFSGTPVFEIKPDRPFPEYIRSDTRSPTAGESLLVEQYRSGTYYSSVCLYVFSKRLLDTTELRFDENLLHEDEGFTPQLYCAAQRALASGRRLFYRRIRANSIMSTPRTLQNVLGYVGAARSLGSYLAQRRASLLPATRRCLRDMQASLLQSAHQTAGCIEMGREYAMALRKGFSIYELLSISPKLLSQAYRFV